MSARGKKKEGDRTTEFQVDEQELQALSQRVAERKIEEKDWESIHRYLLLLFKLSQLFQYGRVKMRKILRMLFGKRTEKEKKKKDPALCCWGKYGTCSRCGTEIGAYTPQRKPTPGSKERSWAPACQRLSKCRNARLTDLS